MVLGAGQGIFPHSETGFLEGPSAYTPILVPTQGLFFFFISFSSLVTQVSFLPFNTVSPSLILTEPCRPVALGKAPAAGGLDDLPTPKSRHSARKPMWSSARWLC